MWLTVVQVTQITAADVRRRYLVEPHDFTAAHVDQRRIAILSAGWDSNTDQRTYHRIRPTPTRTAVIDVVDEQTVVGTVLFTQPGYTRAQ